MAKSESAKPVKSADRNTTPKPPAAAERRDAPPPTAHEVPDLPDLHKTIDALSASPRPADYTCPFRALGRLHIALIEYLTAPFRAARPASPDAFAQQLAVISLNAECFAEQISDLASNLERECFDCLGEAGLPDSQDRELIMRVASMIDDMADGSLRPAGGGRWTFRALAKWQNERSADITRLYALRQLVGRKTTAPPRGDPGADDSAFRPASEFLRPPHDSFKAIKKALAANPTIRRRKPSPQRLEIHAGDWLKFLGSQPPPPDPLDDQGIPAEAIDEALEIELRKRDIRRGK